MTQEQKEIKKKMTQYAFDCLVWKTSLDKNFIVRQLFQVGFTKSTADIALKSILNTAQKEYHRQ